MTAGHALGAFDDHADVGRLRRPGLCSYDAEEQLYRLEGAGANVWGRQDAFHYVWKRLGANVLVSARAHFLGAGVEPHRKLGWMLRSSLDDDAAHVSVCVHGDGLTALQFRRTQGAVTEELRSTVIAPDVIQLERQGSRVIMSVAHFGEPLLSEQYVEIDLGDEIYVGLFVCSHHDDVLEQALFRNVRVVIPARDEPAPAQGSLGSHLEILDLESGHRQIVYSSSQAFEAPNWTTDGRALIYNSQGLLYRFDLSTRRPERIDTGFATRNNNDHVLSFDGSMLAISHHSADDEHQSIVYTLPVEGGTPRRITRYGPSYLHGWSPDGRFLTYTGARNGAYNIYTISVDGGEETQLTTTPGLDDGPEYAPDGQHIYFNSTRSGTMQLWRMRPDGSDQEQLSDDEFNNWFPHISPDGQLIMFISYTQEVEPDKHPPYKRVYLRCMPVAGGTPRVVAYLYGGQGTINVPSWSLDSKRVAFVSNSAMES